MSDIMKKPKRIKLDTAEQDELLRKQKERLADQDSELAASKDAKRRGNVGRASLVSGSERGRTGTPTRTTTG